MKYMKAMIEAIDLQAEEAILTSSCADEDDCPDDDFIIIPCPTEI